MPTENITEQYRFICPIISAIVNGKALWTTHTNSIGVIDRNLSDYSDCSHMQVCGVCDSKTNPTHWSFDWAKCVVHQSRPLTLPTDAEKIRVGQS